MVVRRIQLRWLLGLSFGLLAATALGLAWVAFALVSEGDDAASLARRSLQAIREAEQIESRMTPSPVDGAPAADPAGPGVHRQLHAAFTQAQARAEEAVAATEALDVQAHRSSSIALGSAAAVVLIAVVLTLWLQLGLLRPFAELAANIRALARGARDLPPLRRAPAELAELAGLLGNIARTTASQRSERILALERVEQSLASPLGGLRESLDQLAFRGQQLAAPEQRLLATAVVQAGALARKVEELLAVARLEDGTFPIEITRFDLRDPVRDAVELFRSLFPQREFRLRLPAGPAWVCGDLEHIGQVINNLLADRLRLAAPGASVAVEVEVGEGDPPDASVRLASAGGSPVGFADLFQEQHLLDDRLRDVPGVVLGLNVSKKLLDAQGGRLVEGLDRGLELRLPLATGGAAGGRPDPAPEAALQGAG